MLLVHRAMTDKLAIRPETPHWIFNQCVFFVAGWDGMTDEDAAEASYSPADNCKHVYVLDVPGDEADLVIGRSRLTLDDAAAAEIADLWGAVDADDLLTGNQDVEESIEDGGWHIQRIRAQRARRMGFVAVADRDEQGRVLIVDFAGRNDDLNACWRYLGQLAA